MTIELKKLAGIGAVLAALTAAPAMAQEIGDWDSDGDGALNQEEFNTGFGETEAFAGWDEDASGGISEEEFDTGVTSAFDEDESGDLNEEEQAAYDESGWGDQEYSEWDADASGDLNEEEFNEGVFNSYDDDESGVIEEPEFGDVGDDMGDGGFWDV